MNAARAVRSWQNHLLCWCACAALTTPALAGDLAPGDPVRSGIACIDVARLAPLAGIDRETAGTAQRKAPPAKAPPVSDKEAVEARRQRLRPMTRTELRKTLRALEPIRQRSGEWTIRAATSRSRAEVDYERMQVVYTDAIGLLTYLQADEALARFADLPGSDPKLEVQLAASFDRLGDCLQGRFEPWGGEETVAEMLDMVDTVRPRLESLIIKQLELRRGPEEPR